MEMKSQIRTGKPSLRKCRGVLFEAGFTMIELMIVITIILILIGMAAQNYGKTVQHARETTLHHDLQVMRQAIDNYTLDKQAGYLRKVPVDPTTGAADWVPQYDSVVLSPDQSGTGMVDVHSNSPLVSPFEKTPFNEW